MADFTAAVYQNEFLADGGTDVQAIVSVTCANAGKAGQGGSGDAGEIIIIDTSGSMGVETMEGCQGGRDRGAQRDRRRHLVLGHLGQWRGLPCLPERPLRSGHGQDG